MTQLYAYYQLDQPRAPQEPSGPRRRSATQEEMMALSEERLHVGKTRRPTGAARLRKYVVRQPTPSHNVLPCDT